MLLLMTAIWFVVLFLDVVVDVADSNLVCCCLLFVVFVVVVLVAVAI